jgi:hypothetical protein
MSVQLGENPEEEPGNEWETAEGVKIAAGASKKEQRQAGSHVLGAPKQNLNAVLIV